MVVENDFHPMLMDSMLEQHKKILIDFVNSFLATFDCLSKDELMARINRLNYIGFRRKENIDESCGYADAEFNSSTKKIIISDKHKNSDANIIKSLLYNELIHAASYHSEKNLDSCFNQYNLNRVGLNREIVEFDANYDGPGFEEGELLEEIMTEYYNTLLLQKEGIDFQGTSVIQNYCFAQDYVEYHGTGYYNIAALGQIYDFLFGKEILYAKFHDGNEFRKKFNDLFDNTDIFADKFNDEGFRVPSYSKFVAEREVMERYRTACKMFVKLFEKKNINSINSIVDLFQNKDFDTFLNMLVKTRGKFDETTEINGKLYLLIKEFEANLVSSLFGNKIDEKEIKTSIYLTLEKIYSENNNIDLDNIQYSVFYDGRFHGIYLVVGDEKYIIDFRTLSQDIDYVKLKNVSECGFSKEDIEQCSKDCHMDISHAKMANIFNPVSMKTFIENDGKLYNHHGEEIVLESLKKYSTAISDSQSRAK